MESAKQAHLKNLPQDTVVPANFYFRHSQRLRNADRIIGSRSNNRISAKKQQNQPSNNQENIQAPVTPERDLLFLSVGVFPVLGTCAVAGLACLLIANIE